MKNNIFIYVSKNGNVKVDVNVLKDDIWMSQDVMANLYNTTKNNISIHLKNIFDEGKLAIDFFKTVQNKMHYATHGHTAAEIIFNRVDSQKENLGLTNFKGNYPTRSETEIAKNYLTEEELNTLNKMVSAYLDVAEINALDRHPMTMQDWTHELDSFLKMTRKDILKGTGTISHKEARAGKST